MFLVMSSQNLLVIKNGPTSKQAARLCYYISTLASERGSAQDFVILDVTEVKDRCEIM